MRFTVTGALGHIGSRLIRHLPEVFGSSQISMIDNMSAQRYCSLFNLPKNTEYFFYEADVIRDALLPIANGSDVIIHLAAITNAAGSFEIKEQVEIHNFDATRRVAEVALKLEIPMIHISSTSVYGTQDETVDETCPISNLRPQSPYAETKIREERFLQKMHNENGLKVFIFRFGTIFGPSEGMRFHTAVNKFCWQASTNIPITVWKTAYEQKRPYLDLDDAVRAISFVLNDLSMFDGSVYNALTLNATVKQVVDAIKGHYPNLDLRFVSSPIMNQLSYEVLSEKFVTSGFKFKGNLASGINKTVNLLQGAYNITQ